MFSSWRLENQPSLLLEKCLHRNRPACEIIVNVIEIRLTFIADWRTVIQVQVDCNWIVEVRYVQRFGYGVTDSGERWKGSGKGEGCYNGRSETGVIKEGKMEVQGCKGFRLLCYYEDKSSCLEVLSGSGKPGPRALQCSVTACKDLGGVVAWPESRTLEDGVSDVHSVQSAPLVQRGLCVAAWLPRVVHANYPCHVPSCHFGSPCSHSNRLVVY